MDFQNKVCVVTGGALGIGRCLTRAFAAAGARVAFVDKNAEAGGENLRFIRDAGGVAFFYPGDIAQESDVNGFADEVIKSYGGVDCLINNACLTHRGLLSGCGWENFNEVLRVGITAPYMLTLRFLPFFREGGSVVNIASTRASMSQADTESYSAAKGGILALTHALAVSCAGKVRVNAVSPGWIETGAYQAEGQPAELSRPDLLQHPSGRVGSPEDIARAVMFLGDEGNRFINGENLTVDGGMTRRMIYHGDEGWNFNPPQENESGKC